MAGPNDWKYRPKSPRAASGIDAANALRAREAVRASTAAPGGGGVRELQAGAGEMAKQQGQAAVQSAQQGVQTAARDASIDLRQAEGSEQERRAGRRLSLAQHRIDADRRLSALGLQVDRAAFDSQLQFRRDEAGRLALNQAQLADWSVVSAQSKEQFLGRMQAVQQASERKLALLRTAQARIEATLKMEADGRIAALDREAKERLVRAKAELEAKLAREQADAANRMAIWTTAGTIIGAGAGALIGGPAGAGAGATVGAGVGTAAGATAENS